MAKVSMNVVNQHLREEVFGYLFTTGNGEQDAQLEYMFKKINDRQYGIILTDDNGEERYVRLGAIVAELREDMTARELMQSEIAKYQESLDKKAEKEKKKAEKIAADKARREAEKEKDEDGGLV